MESSKLIGFISLTKPINFEIITKLGQFLNPIEYRTG